MNEDVFTIDPASVDRLGRSNADQRAERKEAESRGQKALNAVMVTVVLTVAAIALMAAGVFIGATKPEVWNYVPGVPSPSGERAEPEESAR
jgi:flagellar basal body-associated protein FliL